MTKQAGKKKYNFLKGFARDKTLLCLQLIGYGTEKLWPVPLPIKSERQLIVPLE